MSVPCTWTMTGNPVVSVTMWHWRQAQGLVPRRQGRRQTLPVVADPASPPLTPHRATWVVLGREDKRTVAEAIDLTQDFAQFVRQRQPAHLDSWLPLAATSTLKALRHFAQGLYEDYDAVKAGVTLPWSNEHVAYCTSSPAS